MSRPVAPIVCDGPGCGKQKQEANHWWTVVMLEDSELDGLLILHPGTLSESEDEHAGMYDFCGQDCALRFVSEQMGKVTS